MKKGLLISTTLAMLLGVGVAVSAHQAKGAEEVKAATSSVKIAGSFTSWGSGAISMELSGDKYVYTREFAANDEFKVVVNDSDWISANWDGVTNTTDGGIVDGGGDDHNFKVATAAKYTIKAVSNIGDYGAKGYGLTIEPYSEPDVPAEDGYYLVGTKSNWKFAGATKMDEGEGTDQAKLIKYQTAAGEEFKARSYLSGVEKWYGIQKGEEQVNYVADSVKYVNIYVNQYNQLYVEDWVEPDVPAEEGYYVKGSAIGWKYDTALKMDAGTGGNVAQKMNITAAVDDEIRVCSYYNDRDPKNAWAEVGNDFDPESEYYTDFGVKEGDNFKFTAAGNYDIYAKYESDVFKFYVAKHVDSYTISMHGVKYAGKDKVGTVDLENQTAYATANFDPAKPEQAGYVARDVYYDEACTEPYTPKKFTEADELYVKYTKLTSYLTGDDTFLGEGHGWDVDYSTEVGPQGANKYVGTVVVPEDVDADHPMKVKPLQYVADTKPEEEGLQPGWEAISFIPGYDPEKEAPDFVSIDEYSNFSFTKPGTYAFYVNGEDKVWFNGGEYAFHAAFLTQVGGTCDAQGKTTDPEALSVLWSNFEAAFAKLSPEEQKHVKDFTIDGGDEKSSDDCLKMIAMYSYIVHKYGTEAFKDFIWGGSYPADMANIIPFNSTIESNNAFIVVAVIASITTLSTAVLLVIKKRKRQ